MADKTGKSGERQRAERLKAALRANLKRRKAQARGRAQEPGPSSVRPRENGDPGAKGR